MLPPRRDAKVSSVYPKGLAGSLQLDYFRRRGRLRRWRGPLGLFCAVGGIVLMLAVSWSPGGHRAFQAAPLSESHALFNESCTTCHDARFHTAARLMFGDTVRSVTDGACRQCHNGQIHHARQSGTTACASCHREHTETGSLTRVDDRHCTACHSELAAHTDRNKKAEYDRVFRNVSGFGGGAHPPLDAWAGKTDPGTIRFSHRAHLKPEGVPVVGSTKPHVLHCQECHRTDEERRYMQPVQYQRDCAACHPLSLSLALEGEVLDQPARREAERFRAVPAPHPAPGESPETVREKIRERLIRFIQGNPAVLDTRETSGDVRPIPGGDRPTPPPKPPTEAEWQWVGDQLDRAEHRLFDGAGGCRYCHTETTDPAQRPGGLPSYAAPGLNARWFPHSRFNHERHRTMNCQHCHVSAGSSDRSSQIIRPSIQTCQQCHNPTTRGARSDCVECHVYHSRREETRPETGLTLGQP
jgi:hypothetical protein